MLPFLSHALGHTRLIIAIALPHALSLFVRLVKVPQ
jgi:hypothetical protein